MKKFLHVTDQFNTGLIADQNGVYELRLKFNGQIFSLQETLAIGDAISFDISVLNEDYIYTCIELVAPDSTVQALEPLQIRVAL